MPISGGLILGAGIAQTGLGIAKSIEGFSDEAKAKKEMANLRQPFYKIQSEYQQNRDLAAQEAQGGLGTGAKDYLTQETQRGLGAGIGATLQGGGDVNNIARLLQNYNQQLGSTAVADAQMHTENINRFMERNKELAGQKTMQWSLNEYQPYERKLNELKQRMAAGKQNAFGGLSDAISGVSALGTGMQNTALNKAQINQLKGDTYSPRYTPTDASGNSIPQSIVSRPLPNLTTPNAPQALPPTPLGVEMAQPSYGGLGWTPE